MFPTERFRFDLAHPPDELCRRLAEAVASVNACRPKLWSDLGTTTCIKATTGQARPRSNSRGIQTAGTVLI